MQDWEQEARGLRKEWESPDLWPRISEALERERRPRSSRWLLAVAAGVAFVIGLSSVWILTHTARPRVTVATPNLLTQQALDDVESSEAAYLQSIDKLAKLASPAVEMPQTPLMQAYRDKLDLLNGAIAELRVQAKSNPLYAQVRVQLAALYREKQETLQDVLDAQKNP
jgi:hypothetical protein